VVVPVCVPVVVPVCPTPVLVVPGCVPVVLGEVVVVEPLEPIPVLGVAEPVV